MLSEINKFRDRFPNYFLYQNYLSISYILQIFIINLLLIIYISLIDEVRLFNIYDILIF